MTPQIFWFLPTSGDTRHLGRASSGRPATIGYMKQIAIAADTLGYDGLLIPTGASCLDPWVVATAAAAATPRIQLLVALRTSLGLPAIFARQAAALDLASNGRLLLNVVPGGDAAELAADGVFLDHDARYRLSDEFLIIWKRLLAGETVDFDGDFLKIEGGRIYQQPVQRPHPPLYFGGSSPAAHELAARHVDVYLNWGEPPAAVAEKIADVRARAAALGRHVRFGLRVHVIVRETHGEAFAAADDLIRYLDDETIAAAQASLSRMDSVGQKRMAALHGGRRDALEISPNLWAGVGLVRGGAGTALVGDPEAIVARLNEYRDIGIDTFVLSGYPHLEEAIRFAELVFPRLGRTDAALAGGIFTGGAFDGGITRRAAGG